MAVLRRSLVVVLVLATLAAAAGAAEPAMLRLSIRAGEHARRSVLVRVPLTVPEQLASAPTALLKTDDGRTLLAQLTGPALVGPPAKTESGRRARELHFVLDELPPGKTLELVATIGDTPSVSAGKGFVWRRAEPTADRPELATLLFGGRPTLTYCAAPLDESTPQAREKTYKPYHGVYSPDGGTLLSKGPGGKFPHHRGLFFGFNKVSYGARQTADVWHCTQGAHQSHQSLLVEEAGPVVARQRAAIDWRGKQRDAFAHELRELTVARAATAAGEALAIDFSSRLASAAGTVRLDGDPQHAGFHFRAAQEVAEQTAGQTYYLRPTGAGKPGDYRNWPDDKTQVDFPWKAMSFVVGGQRYTAAYLDRPLNPKQARFSERDYGRFGSYFEYELTPERPLEVSYRVWFVRGELPVEELARLSADFVSPLEVTVH